MNFESTRIQEARLGREGAFVFTHDHHVDAMEGGRPGTYRFRYEYDVYRFSYKLQTMVVRSYAHEPDQANFMAIETSAGTQTLTEASFRTELFRVAAVHLRAMSMRKLTWLDPSTGYARIPECYVDGRDA